MLADSPSTQWSGSAGAIYPLLRRLEAAGLLRSKALRAGERKRREYTISAAGKAALKSWIGPPFAPEAITVTADPLRTRARFLAALTPRERVAWVKAAEQSLREVESNVRRWHERYGARGTRELSLLTRHAEMELAFRLAWLAEVAKSPA